LIADSKFKFAWDCNDIVKAGELVGGILFGTRQEWLRRKRRGEKERVREAEFQERLKEAERKMKFLMEGNKPREMESEFYEPVQKQWLVVGAVVMSVMLICPPWTKITTVVLGTDRSLMQTETQAFTRYSLLWEPPLARQSAHAPNVVGRVILMRRQD